MSDNVKMQYVFPESPSTDFLRTTVYTCGTKAAVERDPERIPTVCMRMVGIILFVVFALLLLTVYTKRQKRE